METEALMVGVVMQHIAIASAWQSHQWRTLAVLVDRPYAPTAPVCLQSQPDDWRWCFGGLAVQLHSDEAEGYFLNLGATMPCWFVMSRLEEGPEGEWLVPRRITLSYNEAARLMDAGERVDTVALPEAVLERLGSFVRAYYRPEQKTRRKKPSFEGGEAVARMAQGEVSHGGE